MPSSLPMARMVGDPASEPCGVALGLMKREEFGMTLDEIKAADAGWQAAAHWCRLLPVQLEEVMCSVCRRGVHVCHALVSTSYGRLWAIVMDALPLKNTS